MSATVGTAWGRPRRFQRRHRTDPAVISSIAIVASVAAIVGLVAWLMEHGSYDTWAAFPVAIGLVAISVPMLRRAAQTEVDARIARLLWWALGLKLVASLARYVVIFDLYDGSADASLYTRSGADLARQFLDGDFVVELGRPVQGTGFIELLTGAIYAVIGATSIGGFLVFAWIGFWGLYLFHRAFVRACPEGDHWRYARLVFLLPSLLFWPSSIGKEAVMCLGLGVVAYGAARLLTQGRGALFVLASGFLVLGMVRPHVAALAGFAIFLAYLLKRPPKHASILAPLGKLAVTGVLALGLVLAVGQLETFFGVDDFDREAVETTLAEVARNTGQGGSEFGDENTMTNFSLSQFPEAFVSVLFRPYPWQANNLQALIAALESTFLAVLFIVGWRRIVGSVRSIIRTPYVLLCCTYTLLFVYGFSSFSNAGILVRQRVQVLPFVLVLICLPAVRARQLGARGVLGAAEQAPDGARYANR